MAKRRSSSSNTRPSYDPVVPTSRVAEVFLPAEFEIPYMTPITLELPQVELLEPHDEEFHGVRSWRGHARAHHRILVPEHLVHRKIRRTRVVIPLVMRDFEAFKTTWRWQKGLYMTHHHRPERKMDHELNKPMRDWKHRRRQDRDHSRANAFYAMHPKSPHYARVLSAALSSGSPEIAADSVLASAHYLRERG